MKEAILLEEQLDFLREMMNIGAGNAAAALSKLLKGNVDVRIPLVHVVSPKKVPSIISDPSRPVAGVRTSMVGDVVGDLFFVVPKEQIQVLIGLAERATGLWNGERPVGGTRNSDSGMKRITNKQRDLSGDLSVLVEIGNILAGVYLTAIHDFSKLNIYHTVPRIAIDMIQSLLDESIVTLSREVQAVLMVVNEFITEAGGITAYMLLIPHTTSVRTLVASIEEARKALIKG